MTTLREWAIGYEDREKLDTPGGLIIPKAQLLEVIGKPSTTDVHMDIRLAPGANPRTITREISELTQNMGCEVTPYEWSRGYIAQNAEPLIDAVTLGHRYVLGTDPKPPPPPVISMWRDLNDFNEVGIPSICYGPARQFEPFSDSRNGAMKIADLMAATKIYALTAISICGLAKT